MGTGIKTIGNPMALIGILISVAILASVAIAVFPNIVQSMYILSEENVTLGGIGGNFSFTSFFSTGGVMVLILSAIILLAILAIFGVKGMGKGR